MTPRGDEKALTVEFEDNQLAQELFGSHNSNLALIEGRVGVSLDARGNQVTISGDVAAVDHAHSVLDHLWGRLNRRQRVGPEDVDAAVRLTSAGGVADGANLEVRTRQRTVSPRSATQARYFQAIDEHDLVFGLGPAGTGKTYLAVAKAVERLVNGTVERIILSRPAVEAGEQLGFLPGSMREKVDPYLRPLYDALFDMLPKPEVERRLERGEIEVAPLAFMRGRTLANAFVILDEAQNTTAVQMKMFLTRLGENARMVVTGDLSQVDLPKGTRSGLRDALEVLDGVKGVAFIGFGETDVVRHPLVTRIVHAYDAAERHLKVGARYQQREPGGKATKEH